MKKRRQSSKGVKVLSKELKGFTGTAWLVRKGRQHYVVSGTVALFTGWEVLVFKSDAKGKVTYWGDVCGGRGISHEEAVSQLEDL